MGGSCRMQILRGVAEIWRVSKARHVKKSLIIEGMLSRGYLKVA